MAAFYPRMRVVDAARPKKNSCHEGNNAVDTTTTLSANQNRFWSWLCIGAIFANFLLDTMLAPALPAIGDTLGISEAQLGFVFTCGLLSSAIALPLGGRIADIWDKRIVLIGVLTLSVCGAALAALADTFAMAAIGQTLMGAAAILLPLGVSIAANNENEEKSTAMVFVSSGVSALAGLMMGGYILDHYQYHVLFWIVFVLNIGLLIIALIAIALWRDINLRRVTDDKLDLIGGGLLGAGLALLMYGMSAIGQDGFMNTWAGLSLAASIVFFVLWWFSAKRTSSPLIDPRQLLDPIVARFSIIQLAVGFNVTAVLVAVPMIVTATVADGGLGLSDAVSSYLFVPSSIVMFVAPMAVMPLRGVMGARGVVLLGGALIAGGTALLVVTHLLPAIVAGTVLSSVGLGLLLTQTFDLLAVWLRAERVASVSGFILVLKIVGAALGGQFAASTMELLPPGRGFTVVLLVATLMICISIPVSMGLGRTAKAA